MAISFRLVYNVTNTTGNSNVGAFVRAGSDGDAIASQTISAEEWLNTASALFDGSGTALTSTLNGSDQSLDVNVTGLTASDVDIRTLDHTLDAAGDSVRLGDGTNFITAGTGAADNIATSFNGLDTGSFNYGYDGTAWDRITAQNVAGAMDVYIAGGDVDDSLANTAIAVAALSVSTTLIDVEASPLANRKWLYMSNESTANKSMYFGPTGTTAADGYPLHSGQQIELRAGASLPIKVIGETGTVTQDLRLMELS